MVYNIDVAMLVFSTTGAFGENMFASCTSRSVGGVGAIRGGTAARVHAVHDAVADGRAGWGSAHLISSSRSARVSSSSGQQHASSGLEAEVPMIVTRRRSLLVLLPCPPPP